MKRPWGARACSSNKPPSLSPFAFAPLLHVNPSSTSLSLLLSSVQHQPQLQPQLRPQPQLQPQLQPQPRCTEMPRNIQKLGCCYKYRQHRKNDASLLTHAVFCLIFNTFRHSPFVQSNEVSVVHESRNGEGPAKSHKIQISPTAVSPFFCPGSLTSPPLVCSVCVVTG